MLRRLIGEDVEYITIPEQDIGMVKADPGQIEQIVINLAVNARDAMPQGGKLVVETKNVELDESFCSVHSDIAPGPYVMISVSDNGVGMNSDVRARIFEPFFTTKEKGKGTGLGLSTVYGIVKQSGGSIYVYSEEEKGTTFKIYFPQVDAPQELPVFASSDDAVLHGKETILLVEDDEMVRLFVSQVLQRKGYTVLIAAYPDEAIQIEKNFTEPIDLLLTDVVMPNMSGSELARVLLQNRPTMYTIYMSGYTDDAVVRYGVLEDDLHFLQKPFSSNVLLRSIRSVLDGGGVER